MRNSLRSKRGLIAGGLLLGSMLVAGTAFAQTDTETTGMPSYGPGMMRGDAAGAGNTNYAYGPGMMRGYGTRGMGYGQGAMGAYGYGPGMMHGYGAWGGGYGPGMMGAHGYGPGMMRGYGAWGGGYGPGMMGAHGYGPGMMHGYGAWGGGYGSGMMPGYGWRSAALQLSDQQRQRLDAIHAKSAKELWSLMGQLQEQRFALARLMASATPDKQTVDKAYDKLTQTGKKLLNLRLDTRSASWAVLTSEQQKQMEQQNLPPAP